MNQAGESCATDVLAWLDQAPAGTLIPADKVAALIREQRNAQETLPAPVQSSVGGIIPTWRERLWTVPAETRLGVKELTEAVGRSRHWIYHHTRTTCRGERLPHRKLDGELIFLAGEIRDWHGRAEEVVEPGHRASLRLAQP